MLEVLTANAIYITIGCAFLILVLLVLMIILMVQMHNLKKRYRMFMNGMDGKSLENAISRRVDQMDTTMVELEMMKSTLDEMSRERSNSFCKVGYFKYNAFEEGGQLSFTLCLLDSKDDGFVLNSIHTGDGCYTYIKEIINGSSYTKLSYEEQEALDKAKVGEES